MQLLRLVVVAIGAVIAVAGYVHEGRRLQRIRELPGPKARDYYEGGRTRDERLMWVVAALLFAGAVLALMKLLSLPAAAVGTGS